MAIYFNKVLVANRGEIARRIIRTLKRLGIKSVAVFSEADRASLHVSDADEAICIGPAPAAHSYLSVEAVLAAATSCGADAIHPGYGFLSENPSFARACASAGIVFIGPRPEHMEAFGLKHRAREAAVHAQVPLLPGTGLLNNPVEAIKEAEQIGWPVILKSTGGGGGIGMRVCRGAVELSEAWTATRELASRNFKDAGVYVERYVEHARHVEVQIFGDGTGGVAVLGDRDCSAQRRNQKVIEETPAPGLATDLRKKLHAAAQRLCASQQYESAGTVEFVYDEIRKEFYFLEVNTRLQVEHTVTEEVWSVDLVEWMIRQAANAWSVEEARSLVPAGVAIQARLYAEDPALNFRPSTGLVTAVEFPSNARIESWIAPGIEFSGAYDPLAAKIIVKAENRAAAIAALHDALEATRISGISTNRAFLLALLDHPSFCAGAVTTHFLSELTYTENALEVLRSGMQTTVQDLPGRIGYWQVGIPPSGPMDNLSPRIANRIVGNDANAPCLECTLEGPTLKFRADTVICLAGADMQATLDGTAIARLQEITVRAGQILRMGGVQGIGHRAYLAVKGGFDVPRYLGSCSTFTLGGFGGHGGRALREGDVLPFGSSAKPATPIKTTAVPKMPHFAFGSPIGTNPAILRVLLGPQGAPEHFKESDITLFLQSEWEVHFNSSRTGVRLIGPTPDWPRSDGGEAGLHPSNIHDNPYAIGAMDFTGDMPVLLGPDGPSLGGFVCPFTVVTADLWKLGQLSPGMKIRFVALTRDQARTAYKHNENIVCGLENSEDNSTGNTTKSVPSPAIIDQFFDPEGRRLVLRQSGDRALLLEIGEPILDPGIRFVIQWWLHALESKNLTGLIDLTPGIRSLQIHFDDVQVTWETLIPLLHDLCLQTPALEHMSAPSRTVWLPLSWDDPSTRLAIQKYTATVRPDAPWCPSNIEFIRRINGLQTIEEVQEIVFKAEYLVYGLGDVYLGAPVATPLDPRHRLVTTKYNPARTWTPENAVGIGGAYLCVYGMEGPGGYQFVGRTIQMWNRWRDSNSGVAAFEAGKPWLLRFFDRIRFYPVSADELLQLREDFPLGRATIRIEEGVLRWKEYKAFLNAESSSIQHFRETQQKAFGAERAHWKAAGLDSFKSDQNTFQDEDEPPLLQNEEAIHATVSGSLWKILVVPGALVRAGETLAILESMKMEIHIPAPRDGTVSSICRHEGDSVRQGQRIFILE